MICGLNVPAFYRGCRKFTLVGLGHQVLGQIARRCVSGSHQATPVQLGYYVCAQAKQIPGFERANVDVRMGRYELQSRPTPETDSCPSGR